MGAIKKAFFKADCTGGAVWQAITETVTEVLPDQFSLPVHDVDRSLMTGAGAKAAAVALFFINMDNLTDHYHLPPLIF
jgi:hypothetical protein